MNDIINIHRCDRSNVGDWYSTPRLYFEKLKDIPAIDMWDTNFEKEKKMLEGKTIIFGGGGLIGNVDFEKKLEIIMHSAHKLLICWGAGHNTHDGDRIEYDKYLPYFDLMGIRDASVPGTEWVPCVSCMHPGFDSKILPQKKIVVYEHKDHPLDIGNYPKITNRLNDIIPVISFLSSAEIVITNTYHGVYWSTLLNKKVVLIKPFSTKFNAFKYPPVLATKKNYLTKIEEANNYPSALDECRKANLDFSEKVFSLINK